MLHCQEAQQGQKVNNQSKFTKVNNPWIRKKKYSTNYDMLNSTNHIDGLVQLKVTLTVFYTQRSRFRVYCVVGQTMQGLLFQIQMYTGLKQKCQQNGSCTRQLHFSVNNII